MKFLISVCILFFSSTAAYSQSGKQLFENKCKNCHGLDGIGVPNAIPPLKNSDFIKNNRKKSIKAVLEGISGEIHVNGKLYNAVMPAIPLDDKNTAKVFNYVLKSLNGLPANVTEKEISELRRETKYPTYMEQVKAVLNIGLPKAPQGWNVSLAAELDFNPTRIIDAGKQQVLILSKFGDVYCLNLVSGHLKKVLDRLSYLSRGTDFTGVTKGLALDNKRRLYITNDYVDRDKSLIHDIDRVSIYRSDPLSEIIESVPKPTRWYEVDIPAGVGPYNHGISHIEQGPDGWMYVAFGSRTNAGEKGNMARRAKTREHELSAAIWRLKDVPGDKPVFEIFARGFRNPYGFCWDEKGRLFASENGPDKDIITELNLVEQGKHYGFPYYFADLVVNPHEESPKYEGNESFTLPLLNNGPDGITPLEGSKKPLRSFTAHCVPVGMTFLDHRFPNGWKNTMLMCRFGGFWPVNGITTGFDILKLKYDEGSNSISSHTILSALARPIDVITSQINNKPVIVIAEYCRGRTIAEGLTHPGRILILKEK